MPSGTAPGVPRTSVLLPGYLVTGKICIPATHPHALWWTAYLCALLRGVTLQALEVSPPWPVPADPILCRQLLKEMLEHRWVYLDWATGVLRVREDLETDYRRDGEQGLAKQLTQILEVPGEWWIDALSGALLRRTTAQQFDYDHRPLRPGTVQLKPRFSAEELLDSLDVDVAELLRKLKLSPTERAAARDLAYLDGKLELGEEKQIQFLAYGSEERRLHEDLADLVPVLRSHAPMVLSPQGPPRPAAASPAVEAPSVVPSRAQMGGAGRLRGGNGVEAPSVVPSRAQVPAVPAQPVIPTALARPAQGPKAAPDPLIVRIMEQMVRIPPGSFLMGDDHVREESPRHRVTISRDFWLGRYPMTQELWQYAMGSLPPLDSADRSSRFPIIHVSYKDILVFLSRLNDLQGGGGFMLPTEAQWEYACRAGSRGEYCFGDHQSLLSEYAWHKDNAGGRLHAVGGLKPNAFGLYDMHGLVYETVRDGRRPYQREHVTDPLGPLNTGYGARGGSWGRAPFRGRNKLEEHFRCSSRQVHEKSRRVSFRLARQVDGAP